MLKRPIFQRLHFAWIVAGITFLTLIVTAAVRATPSILIVHLYLRRQHERIDRDTFDPSLYGSRDAGGARGGSPRDDGIV